MYNFPELNLFVVDTIKELWQLGNEAGSTASSYITGLLRVVAQLNFGCQTDDTINHAREWVALRTHWSTLQMFNYLLAHVHPLIGVDKSPRTSLSPESLQRALSSKPGLRVIHLTRNPIDSLRSLHDSHIRSPGELGLTAHSAKLFNFYARLWIHSQELIKEAVQRLQSSQVLHVRAEDLLSQPHVHLTNITRWLDINSDSESIAAMQHPERSVYACKAPQMLNGDGDIHFLSSPELQLYTSPTTIYLPYQWKLDPVLVVKMNNLSLRLGYGSIICS